MMWHFKKALRLRSRDVYVTPRRWGGAGLLGAVVRYDSLESAEGQARHKRNGETVKQVWFKDGRSLFTLTESDWDEFGSNIDVA